MATPRVASSATFDLGQLNEEIDANGNPEEIVEIFRNHLLKPQVQIWEELPNELEPSPVSLESIVDDLSKSQKNLIAKKVISGEPVINKYGLIDNISNDLCLLDGIESFELITSSKSNNNLLMTSPIVTLSPYGIAIQNGELAKLVFFRYDSEGEILLRQGRNKPALIAYKISRPKLDNNTIVFGRRLIDENGEPHNARLKFELKPNANKKLILEMMNYYYFQNRIATLSELFRYYSNSEEFADESANLEQTSEVSTPTKLPDKILEQIYLNFQTGITYYDSDKIYKLEAEDLKLIEKFNVNIYNLYGSSSSIPIKLRPAEIYLSNQRLVVYDEPKTSRAKSSWFDARVSEYRFHLECKLQTPLIGKPYIEIIAFGYDLDTGIIAKTNKIIIQPQSKYDGHSLANLASKINDAIANSEEHIVTAEDYYNAFGESLRLAGEQESGRSIKTEVIDFSEKAMRSIFPHA